MRIPIWTTNSLKAQSSISAGLHILVPAVAAEVKEKLLMSEYFESEGVGRRNVLPQDCTTAVTATCFCWKVYVKEPSQNINY